MVIAQEHDWSGLVTCEYLQYLMSLGNVARGHSGRPVNHTMHDWVLETKHCHPQLILTDIRVQRLSVVGERHSDVVVLTVHVVNCTFFVASASCTNCSQVQHSQQGLVCSVLKWRGGEGILNGFTREGS